MGTATVTNATVTANTAANGGGGIVNVGGTVALTNTIVAGNLRGATPDDVSGTVTAVSVNNLVGVDTGLTGVGNGRGNLVGTAAAPLDPHLVPLADNGGQTQTHRLTRDSRALGAANDAAAPATDQRGVPRPVDPRFHTDIGAFELRDVVIAPFGGTDAAPVALTAGTVGAAYTQRLTASYLNQPAGTTFIYAVTGGVLPAELTLNAATGVLSGTPTRNGTATVTISATANTNDTSLPLVYTIAVTAPGTVTGTTAVRVGYPQFGAGQDAGGGQATLYNPDRSVRFTVSPFPGLFSVAPFEATFTGGVLVTAGDITGAGVPELVITPDEGGWPAVPGVQRGRVRDRH